MFPGWRDGKIFCGDAPTFEAQSAASAGETRFAKFVVADGGSESFGETVAQFLETFFGALTRGGIGETDEARVAGKIAIGHDEIGLAGPLQELIELVIMSEGIAKPNEL